MDILQASSIKIKKRMKVLPQGDRLYICGGCERTYKSYPALYLHIKRKHRGVRPLNTKISKANSEVAKEITHTGRPQKPLRDVDDISNQQAYLEEAQSDLLDFLGDKLGVVSNFDSKPKVEDVTQIIQNLEKEAGDVWLDQLKNEAIQFLACKKEQVIGDNDIDLDFDEFRNLSPENPLHILTWLIIWLGKFIVKTPFISNVSYIFCKIWMVLNNKDLQIQDLDNKLVWKDVTNESMKILSKLTYFRNDRELLYEFVEKSCRLIGKTFECVTCNS